MSPRGARAQILNDGCDVVRVGLALQAGRWIVAFHAQRNSGLRRGRPCVIHGTLMLFLPSHRSSASPSTATPSWRMIGCHPRPQSDSPVGAVASKLLATLSKPVAIVPADTPHPARLSRILVPLEGTRSSSLAPRRTIELARDAGLGIVLVHVFGPESVPLFTDQPQHETASWAREFLERYSPCPPEDVRLEIRVGEPHEHVVAVAREIDADVIALGWAQELAAGRAPVVHAALEQAHLPVFLIPVTTGQETEPAHPAQFSPSSDR